MKRVIILLFLFICLTGCTNNNNQDIYGTYTFKEVSHLSGLSSYTVDYLNKQMTGTKYIINADLFKIEFSNNIIEISSPQYVKEEVKEESLLSDVRSAIGNKIKHQYTIMNKDGSKTYWRLYNTVESIWIAQYVDNAADGSEIIMNMCKLSK